MSQYKPQSISCGGLDAVLRACTELFGLRLNSNAKFNGGIQVDHTGIAKRIINYDWKESRKLILAVQVGIRGTIV